MTFLYFFLQNTSPQEALQIKTYVGLLKYCIFLTFFFKRSGDDAILIGNQFDRLWLPFNGKSQSSFCTPLSCSPPLLMQSNSLPRTNFPIPTHYLPYVTTAILLFLLFFLPQRLVLVMANMCKKSNPFTHKKNASHLGRSADQHPKLSSLPIAFSIPK